MWQEFRAHVSSAGRSALNVQATNRNHRHVGKGLMVLFDERVQSATRLDESVIATGGTKPVVKQGGDCDGKEHQ